MSDIATTFVALWLFVAVLPPLLLSHNQHRARICHTLSLFSSRLHLFAATT